MENISDVYLPHPNDQLIIITDGARTPPGVGFVLQARNDKDEVRIVRFYSVKLKPHHLKWSPCEIEAVAFGTAIEAFYDIIKESSKPVIICPDSKPVCDATKLLQQGRFSLSPRIQTFLNNMGKISCEVQHVSGKTGHNKIADFQSRNTEQCHAEICQLCNYVSHQSDTILDPRVGAIQEDIPYSNRQGWKSIQQQDKACILAKTALSTGQLISKKPGKVNTDARRILNQAKVSKDDLLIVQRAINFSTDKHERIVVPSAYNQALLTQMHYKHEHPTKGQLKSLFDKYFFGLGINIILDKLYDECSLCNSMKRLPKEETFTTTTNASMPGTHFVADVMRRTRQKVLVIRDQFSSFTLAQFIETENHQDLQNALIKMITPIRANDSVIIRTDQATGFQKLKANKALEDLKISIELSDDYSKNGTAVVDKGIQELEREITILHPKESPIDDFILSKALLNLNDRLRRNGNLSAKNILFSRDEKLKENLAINDKILAADQLQARNTSKHKQPNVLDEQCFTIGDSVMLKENPKKHNVRDKFLVTNVQQGKVSMQKVTNHLIRNGNSQIRSKQYNVPNNKLFKLKKYHHIYTETKTHTKEKYQEYDPVSRVTDTSEDDFSEPEEDKHNTSNNLEIDMDQTIVEGNIHTVSSEDDHQSIHDNDDYESAVDYDTPEEEADNSLTVSKGEKQKFTELWITSKTTENHRILNNLKQNIAATKIQCWFRRNSQKRIGIKGRLRKKVKPPEIYRDELLNTTADIGLSSNDERKIDSETELSCDWDHHVSCIDLSNNMNEGFIASPLDLKFSFSEQDLNRVFDFDDVFPLHSSPHPNTLDLRLRSANFDPNRVYDLSNVLPIQQPIEERKRKTRIQKISQYFNRKFNLNRGGTPAKGIVNLQKKWGTLTSLLSKY